MLSKITTRLTLCLSIALSFSPGISAQEGGGTDKKHNVLTIVPELSSEWVRNFNPFISWENLPTTNQFVYEPLMVFNNLKGGKPAFRLASGYQYEDDLSAVTVTLRDNLKWSDGKPLTIDDVIFSLELSQKNENVNTRGIASSFTKITKLSSNTIRIDLAYPDANSMEYIAGSPVVPKHIWEKIAEPESYKNENPVGSGPFTTIKVFKKDVYVQCRNPHYYDDKNLHVDCIKMPQISSNTHLLATAINGDLDWMSSFIPDIDNVLIAKNDNYKYWFPPSGSSAFIVNFKASKAGNREAFTDVNFRRAFSMVVDREAIVDLAGYNYWKVNEYPDGLGEQFSDWANPEVLRLYGKYNRYNVVEAKKLLAKAGYADLNGDGFLQTPSGQRIKFKIMVPNGWSDFIDTVQIASEGLKELGINVRVSTPDYSILETKMSEGNFDAAFVGYGGSGATPLNYYSKAFHSNEIGSYIYAAHAYADKELDKLIDEFSETRDIEKQKQISFKIQERIGANQTVIPTMSANYSFQYSTERFTGWFNEDNPAGVPVVWPDTPERLLHLLSLRPVTE